MFNFRNVEVYFYVMKPVWVVATRFGKHFRPKIYLPEISDNKYYFLKIVGKTT